jgi:flavin-binding protein dodecin
MAEGSGGAGARWFGGRTARAMEEVQNALAEAACVRDVDAAHLHRTCAEHGVDLTRQARGGRRKIYSSYLEHCLEDGELSNEEIADLAHLREVLHLGENDVQASHEDVGRTVYGRALTDVLDDLEIDDAERSFLRQLRGVIGLSEDEARQIEAQEMWQARKQAISEASQGDPLFSRARARAGHFTGRSDRSYDAAVQDGLQKARRVFPRLLWFEVERVAGYVGEDGARSWHVTLAAGLDPEEIERG